LLVGVPEFDPKYLSPEDQAKYETLSDEEKVSMQNKWYTHQIPHYESFKNPKNLTTLGQKPNLGKDNFGEDNLSSDLGEPKMG